MNKSLLLLICLALVSLPGCRLNTLDELSWQTNWMLPIAQSESGLENLIQDTSLTVNSQGVYSLVYRDTLAGISLEDLIVFPDIELSFAVRLDSISLNPESIAQQITMGQLATQLANEGNIIGQLIINNHNKTLPIVPGVPGLSSGVIPIDASSFFEFADLDSGFLDLSIRNEFPLSLDNVVLEIRNATLPGPPIVRDTFPSIPSRQTRTQIYDLSGQQIESQLIGELINLDLRDSTQVPIDTSEYIEVLLSARDLKAREATAIFPAQTLVEVDRNTNYPLQNGTSPVRIREMKVLSGSIQAESITTIGDSLQTQYRINNAVSANGLPPELNLKVLPAPPNGVRTQSATQQLEGFFLDMSLGGTTWNQLQDFFKADLLYSGNLVTLDQQDSLVLTFRVQDLKPTFATGYFGSEFYDFQGNVKINWRSGLNLGRVSFADPSVRLLIDNGLGIDAEMDIRSLIARNSQTGQTARLSTGALLAGPLTLERPQLPDTFGVSQTELLFDRGESNLVQVFNLEPDELVYDIRLQTNPNRDPLDFNDFATDRSQIRAIVELDIPLDGILETLVFEDTVFLTPGRVEDIPTEEGILRLALANDFPLEGKVDARVVNAQGATLLSLAEGTAIAAATAQGGGRTAVPAQTTLEIRVTRAQLEQVIEEGTMILYRFVLDSRPANQEVKMYADYRLRAHLSAEFPLEVNN